MHANIAGDIAEISLANRVDLIFQVLCMFALGSLGAINLVGLLAHLADDPRPYQFWVTFSFCPTFCATLHVLAMTCHLIPSSSYYVTINTGYKYTQAIYVIRLIHHIYDHLI